MFGYSREAVRVKVKKCEGKQQPEMRKFSVDPQITSLEVLQSILTKAFDIKSDFTVSYRLLEDTGQEVYMPVLSDWDLDTAFLKAHNASFAQKCEPCINLKIDLKPFAEAVDEWELSESSEATRRESRDNTNVNFSIVTNSHNQTNTETRQAGLPGLIINQMEKTFSLVSRALNLSDDLNLPPRQPLSDAEFRAFLNPVGQVIHTTKLREVIYNGGIEPSLRKVVWKHILNVYPEGMSGKERMDYMKRKSTEYFDIRNVWKECIKKGQVNGDLAYVTSMVKKDVLRTDRHHKFYAGSDDNQNIASLFNILTTYALNHPLVSYCQGMSDLASPLLVTMGDEAHAYICLCALMTRLYSNFLLDGEAMTLKFSHLGDLLQTYDPQFYSYLKHHQADDLLFCYRWLLLEMKREFAFEDSLRMLEVLWSSLPSKPPSVELHLKEKAFVPSEMDEDGEPPISPLVKTPRETAYTKVCAIRRQSSSLSLTTANGKLSTCRRLNHSLDENTGRKILSSNSLRHSKEFQSLDDATLERGKVHSASKTNCISPDSMKNSKVQNTCLSPQLLNHIHKTNLKNQRDRILNNNLAESSLSTSIDNITCNETKSCGDCKPDISKARSGVYEFFSSLDNLDLRDINNEDILTPRPKEPFLKSLRDFNLLLEGNRTSNEKLITENGWRNKPIITLTRSLLESTDQTENFSNSDLSKSTPENYRDSDYDGSSPDDSQEYYPMTTSMTRELRLELEHLDRQVFGQQYSKNNLADCADSTSDSISLEDKLGNTTECDYLLTKIDSDVMAADEAQIEIAKMSDYSKLLKSAKPVRPQRNLNKSPDVFVWENPLHRIGSDGKAFTLPQTPDEQADLEFDEDVAGIVNEMTVNKAITPVKLMKKISEKNQFISSSNTTSLGSQLTDSDLSSEIKADQNDHQNLEYSKYKGTNPRSSLGFFSNMTQELENARKNCENLLANRQTQNLQSIASTITNFQKKYESVKTQNSTTSQKNSLTKVDSVPTENSDDASATLNSKQSSTSLPPPAIFGGGNPFLMFLCLTILLQHRDYIMRNQMDYNELAMHFDKMVRKHNVNRVLNQARQLYAAYVKMYSHSNDVNM